MARILGEPDSEDELIQVLITNLRIPLPSTQSVASRPEIFFPAHIIGSIMNKLLDLKMFSRLSSLMSSITKGKRKHRYAAKLYIGPLF